MCLGLHGSFLWDFSLVLCLFDISVLLVVFWICLLSTLLSGLVVLV